MLEHVEHVFTILPWLAWLNKRPSSRRLFFTKSAPQPSVLRNRKSDFFSPVLQGRIAIRGRGFTKILVYAHAWKCKTFYTNGQQILVIYLSLLIISKGCSSSVNPLALILNSVVSTVECGHLRMWIYWKSMFTHDYWLFLKKTNCFSRTGKEAARFTRREWHI
jgi:hypothetical protein